MQEPFGAMYACIELEERVASTMEGQEFALLSQHT